VVSAASCQLLSFLALAARARIDVVAYDDDAEAEMSESEQPFRINAIRLRPQITVDGDVSEDRVRRLVELGHEQCYIANTLTCSMEVEPTITVRNR